MAKGNHSEFLSLVSLSTEPPQVCHGAGSTTDASHDQAALTALRALSEMGLDSVSPSGGGHKDPVNQVDGHIITSTAGMKKIDGLSLGDQEAEQACVSVVTDYRLFPNTLILNYFLEASERDFNQMMEKKLDNSEDKKPIDVGTCSHHTVHGAYKTVNSVAGELAPYLTIFQNDNPVLPFVHAELYSLARSIAARVHK
ncbi:unnamed protein product, partial [Timema podura]|nr:unnamed protein product [Timema podura]